MEDIKKNLETVRGRIEGAAQTAGETGDDVILVAVSKTRSPEEVNTAIDAGVTDIGENKVQEIMEKYDDIKPVRWHLIGHLQTTVEIKINEEAAKKWLETGAQPTETVKKLFKQTGIL